MNIYKVGVILALAVSLAAAQSNLVKPRIAGVAIASQFGQWNMAADGPILGNGSPELVTLRSTGFTLPDGTGWMPLAVGTPVAISAPAAEIVIPTAVNCSVQGPVCTFTAVFAHAHAGHFNVGSATLGIQEAINASGRGGTVIADADLAGTVASVLGSLHLPGNVLLVDQTGGNQVYYGLGNGGIPTAMFSISSANGMNLGPFAGLNGILFVSTHNFASVTPGLALVAATPATVSPSWKLPSGLIAGDSLYLAGGVGAAEVVTVGNVGTACPGGGAASLCFTPAGNHSGAWTLASATAGIQEAINAAGPGGWVIDDTTLATIHAPVIIANPVRLSGFSAMDAGVGTQIVQASPNTDVIQVGTATQLPQDVVLENLSAVGLRGDGTDAGVAIHCLNCAKLKLTNVTGKQAHDGVYFDSTYGHAYDGDVTNSHFIGDFYGVHMVGGSANRITFVGNTVDANQYGVFDDGGWVHTWIGNDIESNALFGYWQQVSNPGAYSGHNVVLHGNYFEANGANTAGHGDVFWGQLLGGGSGNNGAGCINCEATDNIFNASTGGNVTALNFGAVSATVSDNTYSGYGTGKIYVYTDGPNPNFTRVLSLGDGAGDAGATATSGAYGGARVGTVTRIDNAGSLTLGGWDQLTDIHGSALRDTTVESPTGNVAIRGIPGGETPSNPASLFLDGNSSTVRSNSIRFRNAGVDEYQINNDPFVSNTHDMCLINDLGNPSAAQCLAYINPQGKWIFSNPGPTGTQPTRTQDYQFVQQTNGDSALVISRQTDTTPSGYLLDLEDQTLSHPLFRVDTAGNVVAGAWNNASSPMTVGVVTAAPGSTVGGNPINTTAPRINAQSGTLFASTTLAAGQCTTGGISFTSGVAIGMTVSDNPETVPPAGLVWNSYIDTANHVTVRLCNATPTPITWTPGTLWDLRVLP